VKGARGCVVDVCGKCGGDGSSCAKKRSRFSTCAAVGDPHYRTFDGIRFDYQITGEYILAAHHNDKAAKNWDFEVQNKQRVCPNPRVRCNMGVAVRAGFNTIINYADWGPSVVLINGRKKRLPFRRRYQVARNFAITRFRDHVNIRYKQSIVRAFTRPWGRTKYMDLYVMAQWQWSSGRAMKGLCGNYNNNARDDWGSIRPARQFWVKNTKRSLFKYPKVKRRMKMKFRKGNKKSNHRPHRNVKLDWSKKSAKFKAHVKETCGDLRGTMRFACRFDMFKGEPANSALETATIGAVLDREKLLRQCAPISSRRGVRVSSARLPANRNSFSYSFWYKPLAGKNRSRRMILSKGRTITISHPPNSMRVEARVGGVRCVSRTSLRRGRAVPITVVVHNSDPKQYLRIYFGMKQQCKIAHPNKVNTGGAKLRRKPNMNRSPLQVAGKTMSAVGRIAKLYYIPLDVDICTAFTGHGRNRRCTKHGALRRYAGRSKPKCVA